MKISIKPFLVIKNFFLGANIFVKILCLIIVGGIGWYLFTNFTNKTSSAPQYQTSVAERGNLIVAITSSGTVSSANSSPISTQATGVVSKVYVKDGDVVKAGDKIAEIDLDMIGKQKSAQAYASYQSASNSVNSAQANMYSLQASMFTKWQSFYNLSTNDTYKDSSSPNRALSEFHISEKEWLASEAQYKNQQNIVYQAQTSLNSAWLSYLQSSPTVYAPISGTVSGLSLQVGSVISLSSSSTTSTTTQSSTDIAVVKTQAMPVIKINLTEIDIPKIKAGNKATITMDAFPDKTFTGKVISIDTNGVVSSGVTTYPVTIQLDVPNQNILANMSVSANVITDTKNDVILVPSGSVITQNGESYVRLLDKGKMTQSVVITGLSSDTQTEIVSGVTEGQTIVTSITQTNSTTKATTSLFSGGMGGNRNAGGNVMRNMTR
ncbi:MAG: efflux RND transporter periplasmic adaptor subunit [Candidatus Roizmanbacteria bacterium]